MARGSPDFQPWTAIQRFAATGGAVAFEEQIAVPANTTELSPVTQDIVLCKGFISTVRLRFPPGSAGLMHIAVFDQATQLWPGSTDQWFSGDNEFIDFDTEYDVPYVTDEYKLTLHGWNEDDSYPHICIARMWVIKLPS